MEKSKALANGKIELTVIKFPSMQGFTMLGKMQQPGAQQDPQFMREMLALSYVIRLDDQGRKEKIDLGGGDAAINKAFRDCSVMALIEAQNFAMEVNFQDFFDDAQRKMEEAKASAATTPANA